MQYNRAPAVAPAGDTSSAARPRTAIDSTEVAGIMGAALASQSEQLSSIIRDLRETRHFRTAHFNALVRAAESVHDLSKLGQQIARLGGGRLRQSHERVALDQVVRDALKHNAKRYTARGALIDTNLQDGVEVIVDPGLLVGLVDAAIASQIYHGNRISVRLQIRNWPEHAVLTISARNEVHTGDTVVGDDDSLRASPEWLLLLHLGNAMGITIDRERLGHQVQLTLEFSRTVRKLEGLTATEVDGGARAGHSRNPLSESRPLAGYRVLLVCSDARLVAELQQICREMGLIPDTAPSVAQAVRHCEMDKPDLIIVEDDLRDEAFEELRQDLLRYDINFPCIEVTGEANTFAMSSWMGASVSRVGRDVLREQLPNLLILELAKVM